MREECAEEPQSRELNREPAPVVITTAVSDPLTVAVVEVKEPLELTHRRRLAVMPVAGDLRRAEKIDRQPLTPSGDCGSSAPTAVGVVRRGQRCDRLGPGTGVAL